MATRPRTAVGPSPGDIKMRTERITFFGVGHVEYGVWTGADGGADQWTGVIGARRCSSGARQQPRRWRTRSARRVGGGGRLRWVWPRRRGGAKNGKRTATAARYREQRPTTDYRSTCMSWFRLLSWVSLRKTRRKKVSRSWRSAISMTRPHDSIEVERSG